METQTMISLLEEKIKEKKNEIIKAEQSLYILKGSLENDIRAMERIVAYSRSVDYRTETLID